MEGKWNDFIHDEHNPALNNDMILQTLISALQSDIINAVKAATAHHIVMIISL